MTGEPLHLCNKRISQKIPHKLKQSKQQETKTALIQNHLTKKSASF